VTHVLCTHCQSCQFATSCFLAAGVPWTFLRAVCSYAPEECRTLLGTGNAGDGRAGLSGLLGKALMHAASLLQETASKDIYVSAVQLPGRVTAAQSNVQLISSRMDVYG
jgi:hypothetical protein